MAQLIVKLGGYEISRHDLDKVETTVGRAHECDVVIDNPAISRIHAVVKHHGHWHSIHDSGGSKNGLYYQDRLIRELKLKHGMEITMGKYTLAFDAEGKALEPESIAARANRTPSANPIETMAMRYKADVTARPPRERHWSESPYLWLALWAVALASLAIIVHTLRARLGL